jgi:NTP pyrophosphatase (non-canonical NTP hydrolase)
MVLIRLIATLAGIGKGMETSMGKMKELVIEVLEALEVNDYGAVANQFGMTIPQVVQIAKDYGDIDDSDAP